MNTNEHNKVSEANGHLYTAEQMNAYGEPMEAWKHVGEARRILQELLSQPAGYSLPADPATTAAGKKVEKHGQIDSQYLKQQLDGADPTNPFYEKVVVESGTYEQIGMARDEVAAAIQKLGAKINRDVSTKMDIFVMGNKPGPSKLAKVEKWRADGYDIRIVSQLELKEILEQYGVTEL